MRLTANTDLPTNPDPGGRPTLEPRAGAVSWDLVDVDIPPRSTLGPPRWRGRDLASAAVVAVIVTAIVMGSGQRSDVAGAVGGPPGPASRAALPSGAAAAPTESAGPGSPAPGDVGPSATVRRPAPGDRVGPDLVRVTTDLGASREARTIQVVVGGSVVGSVSVARTDEGWSTAEVPVLGPHADVPAEVRLRVGEAGRLADVVPVILVAAPPAGIWHVDLVDGDRSVVATGHAALAVGLVSLTVRAGSDVVGSAETAVIGGSADRPVSAPFGVGTWSAALPLPARLTSGDDLSLTLELAWSRSPAGPAGSTIVVLSVGDGRGRG